MVCQIKFRLQCFACLVSLSAFQSRTQKNIYNFTLTLTYKHKCQPAKTSAESFLFPAATFLPPSLSCQSISSWVALMQLLHRNIWEDLVDLYLMSCREIFSARRLSCWATNTVPLLWQSFSNDHNNNYKTHNSLVACFTKLKCPKTLGCYKQTQWQGIHGYKIDISSALAL